MVFGEPGIDVRQPLDLPQVSAECGFWVHLVNLFKRREVDVDSPLGPELIHVPYEEDARWQWIFGRLTGGGNTENDGHIARRSARRSTLRVS
jgi:hypothetical protein